MHACTHTEKRINSKRIVARTREKKGENKNKPLHGRAGILSCKGYSILKTQTLDSTGTS